LSAEAAIQYWLSTSSPWSWLGSARFVHFAREAGAVVEVLPVDLGAVFAATGGTPVPQRAPARRSYRDLELTRWSRKLAVPLNLAPRHYPVDRGPSSRLLIAAARDGLDALALSHALLRAIWAEERDIADWDTLAQLAASCSMDGVALVRAAQEPATQDVYVGNTLRAIEAEVFGAPTYVLEGERFWGQDRLELLAERLGGARAR
jgi:2-hydroxychromene-2-carboxylate isomerase